MAARKSSTCDCGGIVSIENAGFETPSIIRRKYARYFGRAMRSAAWRCRRVASRELRHRSGPTAKTSRLPTLPNTACSVRSSIWSRNCVARQSPSLNLRASLKIDAKLDVVTLWNSSTYRKKGRRSDSGTFARLMAANCICVTITEPRNADVFSPSFPFERLTMTILPFVHRLAKVDAALRLCNDVPDHGRREQLPQLVLERRERVAVAVRLSGS